MKEKRKFYHPIILFPDQNFTIQGTKLELVGILIVGIIVALYFGYKHYVQPHRNLHHPNLLKFHK